MEHKSNTKIVVNTKDNKPVGNTKTDLRARYWMFTWNNYPEDWKTQLLPLTKRCIVHVIQPEIGKEGTKHLQGFIGWKEAIKFSTLKKVDPKIHWEKSKSKAAIDYCMKEDTRDGECFKKGVKEPLIKEFLPWQQEINKILAEKPNNRTIYWVYDREGNKGKTYFAKHWCQEKSTYMYVSGKAADMKYAIAMKLEMGENIECCIMDFPRTSEDHISYAGMEDIKNGIFFCTKYKSKQCIYDSPHVICMANFEPNKECLSPDRWYIITI